MALASVCDRGGPRRGKTQCSPLPWPRSQRLWSAQVRYHRLALAAGAACDHKRAHRLDTAVLCHHYRRHAELLQVTDDSSSTVFVAQRWHGGRHAGNRRVCDGARQTHLRISRSFVRGIGTSPTSSCGSHDSVVLDAARTPSRGCPPLCRITLRYISGRVGVVGRDGVNDRDTQRKSRYRFVRQGGI